MDILHKHGLSFASGIHALDIQLKELQEKLTDVRSSFNEKLGQQRRDVGQMHVVLDDVRANQSKSHTDITELGRTVQLLSQRLNNTVEKLTNLQDALGLTDGSLRLVNNGVIGKEGRLEVFYQGQWGTVCDDHFDVKAARVVCKQLGFPIENASFYEAAFYGQGNGMPIHLDDVICYGQERMLVRCSHGAWGFHGCTHAEDVGVKC